jgi:hypothetical protein
MRKSSSFFLSPSKGVGAFIFISYRVIVAEVGAGAGAGVAGMVAAAVVLTRASGIAEVDSEVIVAMRTVKSGVMGVGVGLVGERFSSLLVSSLSLASAKNSVRSCLSW